MSATNKILKALQTGKKFTAEQLANKAKISGVSQRISELRANGFRVLNYPTKKNGKRVNVYELA